MFYQNVRSSHISATIQEKSCSAYESDENRHPNNQIRSIETPNQIDKMSSMDYVSGRNQSLINEAASKDNAQELNILISSWYGRPSKHCEIISDVMWQKILVLVSS